MRTSKEKKKRRILGLVLTVLGICLAIYYGEKKDKPKFEYDVISSTVYFHASVPMTSVKVLLEDSIDIQKCHHCITTYRISASNKGPKPIGENDYEKKGFFGLSIANGTLLEPPRFSSLDNQINDILCSNEFGNSNKGDSTIIIPQLVLNQDDSFDIEVVILHDDDMVPVFISKGKIAGQEQGAIKVNGLQESRHGNFYEAFHGGLMVQIIRFVTYFLISLFLVYVSGFINRKVVEKKQNRKELDNIVKIGERNDDKWI